MTLIKFKFSRMRIPESDTRLSHRFFRALYRNLIHRRFIWRLTRAWPSVVSVINGLKFKLFLGDNFTELQCYLNGRFAEEESLLFLLRNLVNREFDFFDIGANSGVYSVFVAEIASPNSSVFAVEPNPIMAERAYTNLSLNGLNTKVNFLHHAVGSSSGEVKLFLHSNNYGESSLLEGDDKMQNISVTSMSLHELLERRTPGRLLAIKMDIEGFEADAFAPYLEITDFTDMPDLILIEVDGAQKWSFDLIRALTDIGYIKRFCGNGNIGLTKVA